MNPTIESLLRAAQSSRDSLAAEAANWSRALANVSSLSPVEAHALLQSARELCPDDDADAPDSLVPLAGAMIACVARATAANESLRLPIDEISNIANWHRQRRSECQFRHELLRVLAADGRPEALQTFAELVATDPPTRPSDAAVAFAPFWQKPRAETAQLYPRLMDALAFPVAAPIVLDLSNFLVRSGVVVEHPLAGRADELATLLGSLAQRLQSVAEHPENQETPPATLVGETLPLAISLCGSLGLLGNPSVVGKLNQALELPHRRVRAEAAAALARLGESSGIQALVEMATDPSVRLRVLEYLAELDKANAVPEEFRTPAAVAEGAVAAFLADRLRYGVPPTSIELYDARRMPWPGFNQFAAGYLFRYEYALGDHRLSGVALGGPVMHDLPADLSDYPPDDIYAAYIGWSAEHVEIRDRGVAEWSPEERAEWDRLRQKLATSGYADLKPVKLGEFFGERHWVATARRGGLAGIIVTDATGVHWFGVAPSRRPLSPDVAYEMHKGRALVRSFTQHEGACGE